MRKQNMTRNILLKLFVCLTLSLVFLTTNVVWAGSLDVARDRYAETGVTDAALVAYDACNKGTKESCAQALLFFYLDGQPEISEALFAKVPPRLQASRFKFEHELLYEAFKAGKLKVDEVLLKILILFEQYQVLAEIITDNLSAEKSPMHPIKGQSDETFHKLLAKICLDPRARIKADEIVELLPYTIYPQLKRARVSCNIPNAPEQVRLIGLTTSDLVFWVKASGTRKLKVHSSDQVYLPTGRHVLKVQTTHMGSYSITVDVQGTGNESFDLMGAFSLPSMAITPGLSFRTPDGLFSEASESSPRNKRQHLRKGSHTIELRLPRHFPLKRTIAVVPGVVSKVTVFKTDFRIDPAWTAYELQAEKRFEAWLYIAGGLAALGGSGGLWMVRGDANANADATKIDFEAATLKDDIDSFRNEYADHDGKAKTFMLLSAVTGVIGVGLIAWGAYNLTKYSSVPRPSVSVGDIGTLQFIPTVGAHGAGLQLIFR